MYDFLICERFILIDLFICRYGSTNIQILPNTAGIVDTGTTLFHLASDAFQAYTAASGAVLDQTTGLLKIDNPDSLQSLFFTIGDVSVGFSC